MRLDDIKSFADNVLTSLNSSTSTTQFDIDISTPTQQHDQNAAKLNGSASTQKSTLEPMDESPLNSVLPPGLNTSDSSSMHSANVNTRKRNLTSPSPGTSPNSKHQKVADVRPSPLADLIAKPKEKIALEPKIAVKTNMVRSIYISPFDRSTEPAQIMRHLQSNDDLTFIVPDIFCTKLAKKNRRISFVSFKLDVPRHHFDTISDPAIWQTNGKNELTVKEFIEKRAERKINPFEMPSNTNKSKNNHRPSNVENGAKHLPNKPLRTN